MSPFKYIAIIFTLIVIALTAVTARADDPFGGPASGTSGNGTTTQSAIYIGEQCSPAITFPSGSFRWFKVDAWDDYKLQIWLDDVPLWGGAYKYFENNPDLTRSDQSPNLLNGYWLRIYAPDSLGPNYGYNDQQHRADLLTTTNGIRPDGTEVNYVGMANTNRFVAHLLWYEARFNGWVYVRVENRMMWDDSAMVCSHREYAPRPRPQQPTPSNDDNSQNPNKDPNDKLPPGSGPKFD